MAILSFLKQPCVSPLGHTVIGVGRVYAARIKLALALTVPKALSAFVWIFEFQKDLLIIQVPKVKIVS